jgi:hypothetical protein
LESEKQLERTIAKKGRKEETALFAVRSAVCCAVRSVVVVVEHDDTKKQQ